MVQADQNNPRNSTACTEQIKNIFNCSIRRRRQGTVLPAHRSFLHIPETLMGRHVAQAAAYLQPTRELRIRVKQQAL
jgi:hypothetical protein